MNLAEIFQLFILPVLTLVIGAGGSLLWVKQTRKKKNLEIENASINTFERFHEVLSEMSVKVIDLQKRIIELDDVVNHKHQQLQEARSEISELKLEIDELNRLVIELQTQLNDYR